MLSFKKEEEKIKFEMQNLDNELNNKIKLRLNEISKLKKKLNDLEIEKEESKVIKKDMDKVLDLINQGYTRPQVAKKSRISLSQIFKWYSDGKENKNRICIYFYNQNELY